MNKKRKILIVEDEVLIALSEKKQLEDYGYEVEIVASGEQAINFIRDHHDTDVILMDIDLGPGLDGTQAAQKILETSTIPILFLSSHSEPDIVTKTEKITSYGYVVKSSNITVLNASIKMALKLFHEKMARKRVEDHQQILLSIIERSKDFIGVASKDTQAIYVNPAGRAMIGLENESAVQATKIEDYFFAEDLQFVQEEILPTLEKEGRWVGEFRFKHFTTGEPVYVHYDLFKTENPRTGEFINYATVSRNIVEIKKVEEDMRKQLHEKTVLLKDVHQRVTHDLNTLERLLELQIDRTTNPEGKDALHATKRRISNMRTSYNQVFENERWDTL